MKYSPFSAVLGLSILLSSCGQPAVTPTAIGSDLQAQASTGASYAVGFKKGHGVDRNAVEKAGGSVAEEFSAIDAALTRLPASAVGTLRNNPNVEFVEAEVPRHALGRVSGVTDAPGTRAATSGGALWTAKGEYTYGDVALKVPEIQKIYQGTPAATGAGVAVCVGDTGIDATHPEFAGKLKGFRNFMPEARRDDPYQLNDVSHHGTHVSGTIFAQYGAGTGGDGLTGMDPNGVGGVSPGANLYFARVLGDDGSGTSATVSRGVMYCTKLLKSQGGSESRVIISLSLGSTAPSRLEARTFAQAIEAGALVVAAAGNAGVADPHYPSDYPNVIKVGAVDERGALADFSNFGRNQTLVAPGVDVISTIPRGQGREAMASSSGVTPYSSVLPGSGSAFGSYAGTIVQAPEATLCAPNTTGILTNKIALIQRGTCTFAAKVNNAVASGAKAVIVYNNQPGTVSMDLGGQKPVPVVSITQQDGLNTLAAGTPAGVVSVESADYESYNGTSMATPHVAGAAALVWAAKPGLDNAGLRKLLTDTARDLGDRGFDEKFGYGLVDPQVAIRRN